MFSYFRIFFVICNLLQYSGFQAGLTLGLTRMKFLLNIEIFNVVNIEYVEYMQKNLHALKIGNYQFFRFLSLFYGILLFLCIIQDYSTFYILFNSVYSNSTNEKPILTKKQQNGSFHDFFLFSGVTKSFLKIEKIVI